MAQKRHEPIEGSKRPRRPVGTGTEPHAQEPAHRTCGIHVPERLHLEVRTGKRAFERFPRITANMAGGPVVAAVKPRVRGHEQEEPSARREQLGEPPHRRGVVFDVLEDVETDDRVEVLVGDFINRALDHLHPVVGSETVTEIRRELGLGLERDGVATLGACERGERAHARADVENAPSEVWASPTEEPVVVRARLVDFAERSVKCLDDALGLDAIGCQGRARAGEVLRFADMATEVEQKVGARLGGEVRQLRESAAIWRVVALLAPFALAFAAYLAVFLITRPDVTGDEPHYLLVAESIAYDGDVELTNDYASRDRTLRILNFFPLGPHLHAADYTGSGELRPLHGVGLSVLLAPAVALGGVTGARLVMVFVAALLADQLYRLLRALGFRRRYRVLAWTAAVFCLPLLVFSSQIYPELPGALLAVVALRIMVERAGSPAGLALGSAASAALLWLHVRYLPLSLGLFLGLAYAALAKEQAGGRVGSFRARLRADLRRSGENAVSRWRTTTLPLVAPYVMGVGLLAIAFQHLYGSVHPQAPYAVFYENTFGSSGWKFWYEYALADLLDPVIGWIPFVPVHWLGLAALGCLIVRFGWAAAAGLAVAVGYELALASAKLPIGFGLPARYLIIVIPLIAIPLAVAIQHVRAARIVFIPLLACSLVLAAAAVRDFEWLYPVVEKPRIFGLRSVATAFPYPREHGFPISFTQAPGGRFPPTTGELKGDKVVASAGRNAPGFVLWGPYSGLKGGTYQATFPLAVTGVARQQPVATVDVIGSPGDAILAKKTVIAAALQPPFPPSVTLSFTTPGAYTTQTRVYYHGRGTLTAGPAEVRPDPATPPPAQFRDWPLAFLWVAGTILVGGLFIQSMKGRPAAS